MSKLTYGDFYRTGVQDCGNALDYGDFDLRGSGTTKQIVAKSLARWEADGMEEQWLAQQDDFEGLDAHECYENWKAGWQACAERAIEEEVDRLRELGDNPAKKPGVPFYVDVTKLFAWGPKVDQTIVDVNEGRLSFSTGTPLMVSRLDTPRGGFYIVDGHHRAVEAVLAGKATVSAMLDANVPRIERTGGAYQSVVAAKVNVYDYVTAHVAANDNPAPKHWWRRPSPGPRACYRTKADALKAFLDVNSSIIENYGGADYQVSPSEFDSVNHKYDLTGKRAARTIAAAVWAAMPVGRPFCLDRIDLDALNDTSPVREAGVAFRLPDINYELQARAQEAEHYGRQVEEMPDWVTEHEHEPHRVFPPLPSMEGLVPYHLRLEKREPGVEVYSIGQERMPLGPVPAQDIKPVRLQLEEREPGVETYTMNPKDNPAWVTKILAKHFVELEDEVPAKWLPKLTKPAVSGGKMTAAMKEYGCGAYGCVLPTLDPTVVLKLTTDSTEAEFAHGLAAKLSRPVVVKYHLTRALPDRYKGRDAFLLWRDSAEQVGEVMQAVAERGGDQRAADKAIAKQHKAAQDAYDALNEGKPAQKLLDRWVDAADEMGRAVPELGELAKNMIAVLRKDKVFFGDVHDGNIGLVNGHWVIVDPGHVAVLQA